MRGLLLLAALGGSIVGVICTLRAQRRGDGAPLRACDACGRMISSREAHTHHHVDGCGIDDPARGWCRCDPWRCTACCPCSIEALLEVTRG